jgi:small subunit ribosomal protein S3e
MESGAKGCEVVVSGKLRAARAKSMKFTDGFMIHSGQPVRDFVDTATRHVLMRQGVLGIKVKIMRPWDPEGRMGPSKPLPDVVTSASRFFTSFARRETREILVRLPSSLDRTSS